MAPSFSHPVDTRLVETRLVEEEDGYEGSYSLHLLSSDPASPQEESLTGKVTCGAE